MKLIVIFLSAAALCCIASVVRAQSADERLRPIYTEEWKWRLEQFPGLEGVEKPVPDRLPKVDPATQDMRLHYWQDVLHKLDDISHAQLSPEEQINYDVYRPEIENFVADQKFRDYEMPANSDSAFWSDLGETARRPFKTLTDYKNWIAQMRDIPRYFREQITNMRAGLARGFTPPRPTLQGREKSIATIAEGKPEDNLLYTPFREPMVGVQQSDQDKLKSEAAKVIREIVQPAYADLLKFFRDEYVPKTRTTLAAEELPDGKPYHRQKIREFTTLDLSPDEIHQIGQSEVAKLHNEMVDAMHESGFKGEFPEFLKFLRDDAQFYAKTPQDLLNRAAWIAKVFDGKSSQYFGYLPRMRFTIKPVPSDLAPFYTSGRGGPGIYLLNTYDLPHRPLYNLPALTLHESAPGHAFRFRSLSSTRISRTFADSITSPRMAKVGRFIVKSWARKWGCTTHRTSALGCSVIRSGARCDWWWIPAFIPRAGRATRRSSTCTITLRYPSMRSKPRSTVTSPGLGKRSRIIWASSRSYAHAKKRRKRLERNSTSVLSTMLFSSLAQYRCLSSRADRSLHQRRRQRPLP